MNRTSIHGVGSDKKLPDEFFELFGIDVKDKNRK